jgi:hypothetical protein
VGVVGTDGSDAGVSTDTGVDVGAAEGGAAGGGAAEGVWEAVVPTGGASPSGGSLARAVEGDASPIAVAAAMAHAHSRDEQAPRGGKSPSALI